jgi:predicted GNAT family N-acyltransferase
VAPRGRSAAIPGTLEISAVRDEATFAAALELRIAVFCAEQGVPEEAEIDSRDVLGGETEHLVATRDGQVVGTARWFPREREVIVQRVAVSAPERRGGVGRALMDAAEQAARAGGARAIVLHAQLTAQAFYARRGYRADGEAFIEDGIEHVRMRLAL